MAILSNHFVRFDRTIRLAVVVLLIVLLSLLLLLFMTIEDDESDDQLKVVRHSSGLTRRKIHADPSVEPPGRSPDKTIGWSYEDIYGSQGDADFAPKQEQSLISRIDDLKRIKLSMNNELRQLEREKATILKEKASLIARNDRLVAQIGRSKLQLKQLELDINSNRKQKLEHSCDIQSVSPILFNPMKSYGPLEDYATFKLNNNNLTTLLTNQLEKSITNHAFDLSRCPLSREFRFTLEVANQTNAIGEDENAINGAEEEEEEDIISDLMQQRPENMLKRLAKSHRQFTTNLEDACLVLNTQFVIDSERTNRLVINLPNSLDSQSESVAAAPSRRSPPIASSSFALGTFRANLDLVVPSIWQPEISYDSIVGSIPPQSPLERKYLSSYFGLSKASESKQESTSDELNPLEKTLQVIHRSSIDDLFLFIYDCGSKTNPTCFLERDKMIESSMFLIILPSNKHDIDENSNNLLYLALSKGTIPVIIGKERIRLPFDEVIDWSRASLLLPTARLPELHFILRSLSASDLYSLKYFGRIIFERYLATSRQIFDTIISLISLERFNFPPLPVEEVKTYTYNSDSSPLLFELPTQSNCSASNTEATCPPESVAATFNDEILGPREKPFRSASFRRNFSLVFNSKYDLWNKPIFLAKRLYPSHPNDPVAPSEFKFVSPNSSPPNYRPISDGLGGSGHEFSQALGGDYPNEQFTIVVLTYERKQLLTKTLERLRGLAYLNKILVVWNSVRQPPTKDMLWPDVGVPILLVKVEQNSLNNRFLPYDAIETDAIFSMDDDSPLRPDEIVFAFRVWRQSRNRIVGFPGRYHAWDSEQSSWLYNSNHSCELSMVLTGGAFFHKYYTYMYTYEMFDSIRRVVDKFMNCEDIAMNFLVAHLTREPPIKVTSRWTFHCANCVSSLSEDDLHFRERHECLNIFASIYGYMPLLNTQHRSDSILFKTRLPHDKQKCFKFV